MKIKVRAGRPGWRYDEPAPKGEKLLLLTEGRVAVIGTWGAGCVAWSYLPPVDQARFESCLKPR